MSTTQPDPTSASTPVTSDPTAAQAPTDDPLNLYPASAAPEQPAYSAPAPAQPAYTPPPAYSAPPAYDPSLTAAPSSAGPLGVSSEDRNFAVAAHLVPFLSAAVAVSPIGPFVVYLLARDRPFVRENAIESFNFNLTMWIGVMISIPLFFVGIGFLTIAFFGLAMLVFHIVAASKASQGQVYRYPMSWRVLKS
jgi:uncharacterized protein